MNLDLVKYLSAVIRGNLSDPIVTDFDVAQNSYVQKDQDLAKDHFLVDSKYSLELDEII